MSKYSTNSPFNRFKNNEKYIGGIVCYAGLTGIYELRFTIYDFFWCGSPPTLAKMLISGNTVSARNRKS